jgi:hypothetical protein
MGLGEISKWAKWVFFLIATKSFFLNLKMGIFLIATKSFFLNLKMGILGTTKEMGLGESQNGSVMNLNMICLPTKARPTKNLTISRTIYKHFGARMNSVVIKLMVLIM